MDGWGTGTFSSNLGNLLPNKTYYTRAYAVSEFGIGYGSQQTFTTKKALYSFHEDFTDNTNKWDTGSFSGGNSRIIDGKYVTSFQQSGYLWTAYKKFPEFESVDTKDFEISTSITINSYNPLRLLFPGEIGGLVWNTDDTHFSYFAVKKAFILSRTFSSYYKYTYQIGNCDGAYDIWKDFTEFTGTDSLKLTIKKASDKIYFFINDVQVYSHPYNNTSFDGVGFMVENATVSANYLYIDQKDFKKTADTEIVELKSLPGGRSIFRSFNKK
jgi:hypothetical protein